MEVNLFTFPFDTIRQQKRMRLLTKIREKGVAKLLGKACIFIFILFILDFSIGSLLRYLYFKQSSGLLYRTTYSLDSTTAQFLIFGSSTANHHYDPSIFEDRINMSVYNTGRDANTIFYNYAVFQSILKRYTPKIAILDFNVGELKVFPQDYDRISSLLPYYNSHPELHPIIQLKNHFEKYKLLSKIYPFNSLVFTILIGATDFNKSRDYINDKNGFVPLTRVWKSKIRTYATEKNYKVDSTKIALLQSFIQQCKSADIHLYICISPIFKKFTSKDVSANIVQKIATEYEVPFYNFSNDTMFWNHPEYFADIIHLNGIGAKVYSDQVVDKIIEQEKSDLIKTRKKPVN